MPIGKRPRPSVARGKGSERYSSPDRSYPGTRGNKAPTGSRPRPNVAGSGMPGEKTPPPGNRRATKQTPMPTPKRDATRRSR